MARDLMSENYYITRGGMVPVKWTAPEVSCSCITKLIIGTAHGMYHHCIGTAFQEVFHCQ